MFGKKPKAQQPRQYEKKTPSRQQLFSYRSSRSRTEKHFDRSDQDSFNDENKKTSLMARIQYISLGIVMLLAIGYMLSLDTNAQVVVEGPQTFPREDEEYKQFINGELKSSPLNRTKLTLNDAELSEKVKLQFPEVRVVEVDTGLLRHRPKISIYLTQPTVRLVTPSAVYVLDEEGYVLFNADRNKTSFDIKSLTPISDNSGQPIEIGQPAVTTEQIAYVREVIGQFKHKDLPIEEMRLEGGGLELHVELKDTNYFIKFSFLADARQSSGAYMAIREQGIPVNQYVDVRIPDRAYVR